VRQLVRVAVAAAALLGVLGLPTPAAAETAQHGHNTLNQVPGQGRAGQGVQHLHPGPGTAAGKHRTRAAKLADGTWRYQYEDVTTATNIPMARLEGVRGWVDAP
jgi:hypothetical protein